MSADSAVPFDRAYELDDRYRVREGRVFLTGNQALVRIPLMQRERDRAAGLDTAGFISGYRGSPLGIFDMNLWQAKDFLEANEVRFEPGLNEDLAATAVWGSQQAHLMEGATKQGVFGIWYGKGPGIDRSCDALKHGNYMGAAEYGGVLVLMGDDPGAKSSSIAHQSEPALIHCGIPILHPSNVQEYLDFGLHGIAMSRFSGCWVGFKCLTDTVESSASVEVSPGRVQPVLPDDAPTFPGGVHIAWENMPLRVEQRLQVKLARAKAYARANGLDRVAIAAPERRLGIVTTGKAYLDVRQALEELGVDEARAAALGLSIYKVGMPWPLEPEGALAFARGHEELFVIEEKKPIVEEQLAHVLYNEAERPRLIGKRDEAGQPLVPETGELAPGLLVDAIGDWLERRVPDFARPRGGEVVSLPVQGGGGLLRLPSFCSGCPHNRSTKVPDGSVALGGIGCHGMAVWLPDRHTLAVTQMGGEGTNWIGIAPFTETKHIFQNMGDGTYFHSGLLAIRAAVAAGANITYKILLNGAVAMTGGQPIEGEEMAGEVTTPEVVRQLLAEGLARVDVLSNEPKKYRPGTIPPGVRVHHRDALDRVQRQLRETPGVTAIVYDQTCAAEARRLRKRGEFPDPDERVVINERVCEGCGDCSVQSNCIAIEPVETRFGRKRRINQSSCNKDYSCLLGYCPSFVTVKGGRLRTRSVSGAADAADGALFEGLPDPVAADCEAPFNVYVAGIGGTGVITVGALLGMAAHLEGKGASLLDVTGLAQKNGPVSSHVRIAARPEDLFATRIAAGAADLVLGCDIVVTTSPDGLTRMSPGRTTAVVNTHVAPTADFATNADLDLSSKGMEDAVARACREGGLHALDATHIATSLFGDAIAANLFMLGYAMQLGLVPVSLGALERAIELNGRAVDMNKRALRWGRLAAWDRERVLSAASGALSSLGGAEPPVETLDELVASRSRELVAYQGERLARRYRALVEKVRQAEARHFEDTPLTEAVARYAHKVMAYKDEYEVARLYTDGSFEAQIAEEFEGDYEVRLHLAPQVLPRSPLTGRPPKLRLGRWFLRVLAVIAKLRFLRGTPLDPTQLMAHRRLEQQLIRDYEGVVETIVARLGPETREVALELASLPEHVRGFDDVKEANLEKARAREAELLEKLRGPAAAG